MRSNPQDIFFTTQGKTGLFFHRQGLLHDTQNDKIEAMLPMAHAVLSTSRKYTDDDKKARGWATAYSLQTMEAFPGGNITVPGVVFQNLSRGLAGTGGGPKSAKSRRYSKDAAKVRSKFQPTDT